MEGHPPDHIYDAQVNEKPYTNTETNGDGNERLILKPTTQANDPQTTTVISQTPKLTPPLQTTPVTQVAETNTQTVSAVPTPPLQTTQVTETNTEAPKVTSVTVTISNENNSQETTTFDSEENDKENYNVIKIYANQNLYNINQLTQHIEQQVVGLKFENVNDILSFEYDRNKPIQFQDRIGGILGFTNFNSTEKDNGNILYRGDYRPYMNNGMTELFIYSDIVKPQQLGDTISPLIATTTHAGKDGQRIATHFKHHQYYELNRSTIESIHMYIRSESGEALPFLYGNFSAHLHFRKKRF
jgi:hypothetical protein